MAKYTKNGIYTYVVNKVKTEFPDIYHTSRYEPVPASFPCIYIIERGKTEYIRNMSLDRIDDQWAATYEVQVLSNKEEGAEDEANAIMDLANLAFREMYFQREMIEDIGTKSSTSYRTVARFRRIIGGGEDMPL